MSLNIPAIEKALRAQPLCQGLLKNPTPENHERCAAGALLAGIGVTDTELIDRDEKGLSSARRLFIDYQPELYRHYGIENVDQLASLIRANDCVWEPSEIDADFLPPELPDPDIVRASVYDDALRLPSVLSAVRYLNREACD